MTCKNCKKEVPAENKFCSECGAKIEKESKPNFVLVGKPIPAFLEGKAKEEYIAATIREEQEAKQKPYWIALVVIGVAGIISWKVFNFALPLYIGGLAFFVIPAYLAYKSREFNFINWILYTGMGGGVLINFFTDAVWAIYLTLASVVGLVLYNAFQEDKKMTPEQKEHEFKTAFYDLWKKQAKREGKTIDPKEEEYYKKEQSKFNTKNTLTVILPMAIFITLQKEFGVPQAMFIGLVAGGVIRFLYSLFEKKP